MPFKIASPWLVAKRATFSSRDLMRISLLAMRVPWWWMVAWATLRPQGRHLLHIQLDVWIGLTVLGRSICSSDRGLER
jgi:hypothetical protein